MTDHDPLVVGVDASTSGVKAVVFDRAGRTVAEGRAALSLQNPSPDGWEQDALGWLDGALSALAEATSALGPRSANIRALAVAHQRETFVVTDALGQPLAPAIVWMDARCRAEVRAVTSELSAERLHAISGKPPCVTPSLYKIRALFDRLRPELRAAQSKRVLDVHAFLVLHLTGEHATSLASADPLGLVDMVKQEWSSELCALARVEPDALPRLLPPGAPIGAIRDALCDRTGLPRGTVLVAGAGDGQAAGLGAGVLGERSAYLNLGTAVVSGIPSKAYRTSRAFRTLYGAAPGTFLCETDLKGGTFILDWLADRWLGDGTLTGGRARLERLAELERRAATLTPGASRLLALPYWAGVMSPHWNDDATGALVGLRADHGPEHVYRAICEGIALEQRSAYERVEAELGAIERVVCVGGGARRPFFRELCASVLGRSLELASADETTALGAAMIAAPQAGLFSDIESAGRAMSKCDRTVEPSADREIYDRLYRDVYADLYPALERTLGALSRFDENVLASRPRED